MSDMGRGAWRLRALLAVMAGGLVVHELRYRLAGVDPHDAAHAYLPWLQIVLAAAVIGAVVEFGILLRRLVGRRRRTVDDPPYARVLWPALTLALVVLVGGQELAELQWLGGHEEHGRSLVAELVSDGGWLVAPLSLLAGGICALLLRGAAALARIFASKAPPRPSRGVRSRIAVRSGWRQAGDVLARRLAGRGPPLLVTR